MLSPQDQDIFEESDGALEFVFDLTDSLANFDDDISRSNRLIFGDGLVGTLGSLLSRTRYIF